MRLCEIKLGVHDDAKAKAWIKEIYAKYPANPINSRQRVMVWGEGEEQTFAMFELSTSNSASNAVEIYWFQAYPLRKGTGTKAMKTLQEEAQKAGIKLTLFPWDKGVVSQTKLIKFYKSLGFRPISKGSKNMIWEPTEASPDPIKEERDWAEEEVEDVEKREASWAAYDLIVEAPHTKFTPAQIKRLEKVISTSAEFSYHYAKNVLDGNQFKLGEPEIEKSRHWAFFYTEMTKIRMKKAEPRILDEDDAKAFDYMRYRIIPNVEDGDKDIVIKWILEQIKKDDIGSDSMLSIVNRIARNVKWPELDVIKKSLLVGKKG